MDHFRRLERMYLKANVNTFLFKELKIQISEKQAEISMPITPNYYHSLGAIHGSVYFKLLDDSAFFAVNSIVENYFVLTTSFTINITKPVNKGVITAVGSVRFASKNMFIAEAKLLNENAEEIAFGFGNFVKSKIELSAKIGY